MPQTPGVYLGVLADDTYKESSITSRASAAIWSNTNPGPTGQHHP
jgi:hypothetical protein